MFSPSLNWETPLSGFLKYIQNQQLYRDSDRWHLGDFQLAKAILLLGCSKGNPKGKPLSFENPVLKPSIHLCKNKMLERKSNEGMDLGIPLKQSNGIPSGASGPGWHRLSRRVPSRIGSSWGYVPNLLVCLFSGPHPPPPPQKKHKNGDCPPEFSLKPQRKGYPGKKTSPLEPFLPFVCSQLEGLPLSLQTHSSGQKALSRMGLPKALATFHWKKGVTRLSKSWPLGGGGIVLPVHNRSSRNEHGSKKGRSFLYGEFGVPCESRGG